MLVCEQDVHSTGSTLNLCYEKLIVIPLNVSHEQPVTVLRVAEESAWGV